MNQPNIPANEASKPSEGELKLANITIASQRISIADLIKEVDRLKSEILTAEELSMIRGALDSLGVVLADYDHTWTEGEKEIYEQAIKILS